MTASHLLRLRSFMLAGLLSLGSLVVAKDELIVNIVSEPASLDPHLQWNPDSYVVYRNIFDNLVTRDDDSTIVPHIAISWEELSETEIEFRLRDDVTFHDGEPLTAEDVVYSVKRITDPAFNSPQLGQFNQIIDAVAVDDHTVRLTTDGAYPALLAQLVKLSIVPRHVVEVIGDDAFGQTAIGSGPYIFVDWRRGVEVTLRSNSDYWGGDPPFEQVSFRAVSDGSTRLANLISGSADLITNVSPDQAAQLEATAAVNVRSTPTERLGYVLLNTLREPTNDINVRRALAHGFNGQLIVEALLGGYGELTGVMLTPVHFGYTEDVDLFGYDAEQARQFAEAAGDIGTIQFSTSPNFDQNIVGALQQMGNQLGFDIEIVMRDQTTHLQFLQGDPLQAPNMNFGRWSCACLDADGVLYPLFHSDSPWSKYSNPEMDALLEAARTTLDPEERQHNYDQVLQIVHDEALAVPLYQASAIYGANEKLEWQATPDENIFIMRMRWND